MEKPERAEMILNKFFNCYLSLEKALDEVGGCVPTIKKLKEITAYELIVNIAMNDITFQHLSDYEE